MSTIVTRSGKGSPLSHVEVDANFNNLNTDKVEKTAAAITGGTINGTTIGATTPAAGTFTTITGQTEVLRGTGSNLFLQSNTFTTSWSQSAATVATTVATTDPFGGSSAWILTEDSATSLHRLTQAPTTVAQTYTVSCYFKANTRTFAYLRINNSAASALNAFFNLSTGALGTVDSGLTAAILSIGNGWYRCSATVPAALAGANNISIGMSSADNTLSYAGNGTSSIYLYGAQLEAASPVGTYTATTTTAVYGTPTLSFSGVSEIGLLSTGALYLQPAGTGALQAQATTSSTVGGNARGANAVDFQMVRSTAAQVASASTSFIGNGRYNTASGQDSVVVGGYGNTASSVRGVIAGGESGTASGNNCYVGSGYQNTAAGNLNFIGGGQANSGTSGSAVTTQTAATTSGSTAVTLAASNANIKVGQWVEGTGVNNYTYVAAVSGTSLTLSANASSTNAAITLTFKTPHGVVVGGGNNQATGSYSFIGGGGDAGTAANRNVASGDWSAVGGGVKNVASGAGSVIAGGGFDGSSILGNTASGSGSFVGSGISNVSSAGGTVISGGFQNTANASLSTVNGGRYGTTRSIVGISVFPSCNLPIAAVDGVSQASLLILGVETTDATATALRSNSAAASGTNQVILPNNSAYFFTGEVVSGKTAGGDTKGWTIEGVIKRGANAASTALVGTPTVTSLYADAGAATWALAVTADTTNGGIQVTFTGQAATTIRTVCQIRTTEMTY